MILRQRQAFRAVDRGPEPMDDRGMSAGPVEVAVDGRGVATVTLRRPEVRNAMDRPTIDALATAATRLGDDAAVRAVVLQGAGRAFCAGGDLGWMRDQMAATPDVRAKGARALADMLGAWDACPKPVIGRVHGAALGGGVGLVCVCDVAIAADDTRLGLTEVRLGLIPATIGPYVVARMGPAARRVFMSGRIFGAAEAVALGLLARCVPAEELGSAVEAEVAPYLDAAPGAVAAAKALARALSGGVTPAQIDRSVAALVAQWEGDEAPEGVSAFLDKRPARWAAPGR